MRLRNEDKVLLVKLKAIETIAKYGFDGFSMNKLAKACHISVATLYIYFKDRDDLIVSIAKEEIEKMSSSFTKDFVSSADFESGMRIQWRNRRDYVLANPYGYQFLEQLRGSTYKLEILKPMLANFKKAMETFFKGCIERGEINAIAMEAFWSVAYAPLYSLLRFDRDGKSIDGKNFKLSEEVFWQTFDSVMKALKK
ncbi:TetR/AcrR family transcriptional regulator [Sphingobacterium sp. SRCM116780]|uniref:TetR/AcrR family transcriptional regulator n=1 Tax=Sphingobacterium sp. SRCM116780 TaxID=2907623 RepID=UPI001F2FE81C|nr:TetR/AcrR family transcriptional regulator [Sphingobacterium sp. SRCM116780]UIR56936.1 TetR/AcrR family transcriptional regulator [Sphingobacterium sp. SRCM116780]